MADIGAAGKRSGFAGHSMVIGSFVGLVNTAQASVGSVLPRPCTNVGRRIADWAAGTLEAVRAMIRTLTRPNQPKRRYYDPRRDSYLEDAVMSREMLRL
jgi:hypothetical protein